MTAVRPATLADRAAITATLGSAFTDDPVWRWLVGDHRMTAERAGRALASLALPHVAHGHSTIAADGSAVAVWAAPKRFKIRPGEVRPYLWDMVRGVGVGGLRRLMKLAPMEELHPPEPHWYLAILGTHADRQGKGLGSAVMASTLARADAEGVGCWLESSSEDNVPFYRRHGFEVVDRFEVDGGRGPTIPLMWRDPRPPGS